MDEMKKAIEQRDIAVQKFDEEKQNEINDYNNQIEQLIQDKNLFDNVFSGNKKEENNINKDDIIKELNLHKHSFLLVK